jgi:putative thioredoxin
VDPVTIEVGDGDFESAVLERSRETPVAVDFWAPWCGPCRTLGPLLERLAEEHAPSFLLAKVNVDESPVTAQQWGIRSIPTVIGLRDRQIVAEFQGAQPERMVRAFIEELLPSRADQLATSGATEAGLGKLERAEAHYRAALELEPHHTRALVGLAAVLGEQDRVEEALSRLDLVTEGGEVGRTAERLAARLRTGAEPVADLGQLRERLAGSPNDLAARLELGRALAALGDHAEALAELFRVVEADPGFADEAARKAMLDLFALLGAEHPLTGEYRRALARVLFR